MTKAIPLTQGKVALVDDADFDWLNQWKWCAICIRGIYYAVRAATKNEASPPGNVYMHRFIMGAGMGQATHHLNGDGLDNRRDNIRICTAQEHKGYHQGPYKTVTRASATEFGRNLRIMRVVHRNLTQAELAELAMTSRVFISHIEVGKMLPSPDLEKRLREALDWGDLEDEAFAILGREPAA